MSRCIPRLREGAAHTHHARTRARALHTRTHAHISRTCEKAPHVKLPPPMPAPPSLPPSHPPTVHPGNRPPPPTPPPGPRPTAIHTPRITPTPDGWNSAHGPVQTLLGEFGLMGGNHDGGQPLGGNHDDKGHRLKSAQPNPSQIPGPAQNAEAHLCLSMHTTTPLRTRL